MGWAEMARGRGCGKDQGIRGRRSVNYESGEVTIFTHVRSECASAAIRLEKRMGGREKKGFRLCRHEAGQDWQSSMPRRPELWKIQRNRAQ